MKEITTRIKQTLAEEEANVERSIFDKKYFVSFFAAEIDTARQMITYVNAGHPPPLTYSQGRIDALAKGGMPLGVFASLPPMATQTAPFPRGGMLVAYTDGIWERTNAQDEQFGEGRLARFVAEHSFLSATAFVKNYWLTSEILAKAKPSMTTLPSPSRSFVLINHKGTFERDNR